MVPGDTCVKTVNLGFHPTLYFNNWFQILKKKKIEGSLGGTAVWHLSLAQGVILETRDQIPGRAPCMEPASPSACVSASLCVSHE